MRAISVHQPWAWAILHAGKAVENRSWQTHHRGPLLVHASRSRASYDEVKGLDWPATFGVELPPWESLTTGAILGVVTVVDCVRLDDWRARRRGGCILAAILDPVMTSAWAEGPQCWLIDEPQAFVKPVPWRGGQGFFDVPEDKLAELAR